ncbi:hypothetical protein FD09_GL000559 [Schleiferilactobacillus perolens DSM 12744]|uniref:WxL Interacting Protein host binding domain-containing protein n=1 Tax=Schleiferilactobacillus perolens DSM 12744 TaxID=1423792 RepID=A0A0R1MUN7_9LACO|nr:hypothetical protein FD09_GL000559 [Schleiferilactobacillus perolens DSM 12744]
MGARTQKVTLPPNKTVKIVQRVKMIGAPFDGVVLGGYTLSSAESTLAQAKKSGKLPKKTGFVNNFAYSVGVLIIAGHSEQVQPDFRLRKVGPRVVNAQSALLYQLQNFQPMYIQNRGLKVTGQMTPRGSSKIIISNSLAMSFAPNSTASILMKFGSQQVPAGKFTLHVVAKSDGRTWQFKRDFSISNAEANRLNKSNASVKQSLLWLWILIGLFILLVATILVVWLYRRAVKRGRLEARRASWKKN